MPSHLLQPLPRNFCASRLLSEVFRVLYRRLGKCALHLVALLALAANPATLQAQIKPDAGPTPVSRTLAAEATNRVIAYTAWDDDFFYVAVVVNKPTLKGTNSLPFSNPLADDAVIVSLQADNDHTATKPTAKTRFAVASAVGGAQLYIGPMKSLLFNGLDDFNKRLDLVNKIANDPAKQQQERAALFGSLLKFQVTPKGAQRPGGTFVPGYTVEIAIPWGDLGGRPEAGAKLGINVVAQSISEGSPPMQSLAPKVTTPGDVENPSLWSEVILSNSPQPSSPARLICPRVLASKPVIDGELSVGEWNGLASVDFGERVGVSAGSPLARTVSARLRPAFKPQPPRPVVPLDVPPPVTLTAHQPQPLARLVMARYDYHYQADPRKSAPSADVTLPSGQTLLAHHPLEGTGPWLSYDRADWHRHQLLDARRAGIDVLLPVYRGDAQDRLKFADKGLTVMVAALQSLRQSGQDYPQIALFLDTEAVAVAFGQKPDLKQPTAQDALYAMVRDFYRHIPAAFRCQVTLSAQNGGRIAYPVFLSGASAFSDFDSRFVDALRARFAREFVGADLLILGSSDFKPKAALDGYFTETKEKGFQFNSDGWIKTASIGAGYDSTLVAPEAPPALRARRGGDAYRDDWKAALSHSPDWALIDGWNEYNVAAEVAPTFEEGYSASDITREYTRLFAGLAKRNVKFLSEDTPRTMLPQERYRVHLRAQNTGIDAWGPLTPTQTQVPVAFAYRWMRDGREVARGAGSPFTEAVPAGQSADGTLEVSTANLAEGAYTLEVRLTDAQKKGGDFLGENGVGTLLQIPVQVSTRQTAWSATLVRTDLPTMLESGSVYEVQATLRNDGGQTWRKADAVRVSLRLYRTTPADAESGSGLTEAAVAAADASAEITQDVAPGQETSVKLRLPLTTPDGSALPAWRQEDLWTYTARWEVAADKIPGDHATGNAIAPTPLAVVDFDFGARFLADGTPASLLGERRLPVSLSLQNVGPQAWKHDAVRVGYHWYYQDGTEFLWEDETTPLPADVPPGGKIDSMVAWVSAPPYDGTYWLVWDVKVGDIWASTGAATRVFDESVRSVQVVGGRLSFADLTKAYNLDGITDDNLLDGDFDGKGDTLAAGLLPPYANNAPVPAAAWLPAARSGPDSPRRISFRWGPKDTQEKNFIQCLGQKVEFGKSSASCRTLHILATSTGKDIVTSLKLMFEEPTSISEDLYALNVSRWDQGPKSGEEVAYQAKRYHDRKGWKEGTVSLYHYVINIKEPRKLVALQLPMEPDLKIAAITLEK